MGFFIVNFFFQHFYNLNNLLKTEICILNRRKNNDGSIKLNGPILYHTRSYVNVQENN